MKQSDERRPAKCPHCGSQDFKAGAKGPGGKPRYDCVECGKNFGVWGGGRRGAGAPRRAPAAQERTVATMPAEVRERPPATLNLATIERVIELSREWRRRSRPEVAQRSPFIPAQHPPRAMPEANQRMAMDSSLQWADTQFTSSAVLNGLAAEGLLFPGYPYLAELAQRPEYRVISETIADDATREWIDFEVVGEEESEENDADDPTQAQDRDLDDDQVEALLRGEDPDERKKKIAEKGKTDKVKALKDEMERLQVRDRFYCIARDDGFFGRAHLYMNFGEDVASGSQELGVPIGDGRDKVSRGKIGQGSFKELKVIEAVWAYPMVYNATNPLLPGWYDPQVWYVMGTPIDQSRMLKFVGHPVSDLLKPAYSFGGLSLSQMAEPYVNIWLKTRQSVAEMIHAFSVMVLSTDLATIGQPGNAGQLLLRAALFNEVRDNQGLMLINKATEALTNVAAPLGGLHELQAQAQEHMSAVSRIPLVKLTGISPSGLNASSEGEIRAYYDTIAAFQNRFMRPNLTRVINFMQLSLWGEIDSEITFKFQPLWALSEKERGEKEKNDAERHQKYVDMGAIAPGEVRKVIVADPSLPYTGLNPEDIPEPPAEQGLLGPGAGGAAKAFEEGAGGGEGGQPPPGGEREEAGARDAVIPFDDGAEDEGQWEEGAHPRAPGGQFTSKGGGSGEKQKITAPQYGMPHGVMTATHSGPSKTSMFTGLPKKRGNIGDPVDLTKMTKVGGQMGSNPGGVYESGGKRFYVKQGKSPEHVRNEMIAASLYDLAGTPTLEYRPVEGGKHIATEMEKLDKDNASKLSSKEKREAQKDFAVHAWLGNWDAVGLGGDNLGTVKGVPTALDLGGAMEYRAQGAPKGKAFGDKVGELDTLRDPKMNSDAAGIFGSMTPAQMRESARYVTGIPDHKIRERVEKLGGKPELADKLIARKNDIAKQAKMFGAEGDPKDKRSTMVIPVGEKMPVKELNGVKFDRWRPPTDWSGVEGQAELDEPEFMIPTGKEPASGVVIREKDGRVWIVQPRGGYGGYDATFPKGRLEEGLSLQANAIKEAYEESGLKVKIVGHAGDHTGDATHTRYYFAEREAGDPSEHDNETEGVVLAPPAKASGFLNRDRDRKIIAGDIASDEAGFQESDHPRGPDGKFIKGVSGAELSDFVETTALKGQDPDKLMKAAKAAAAQLVNGGMDPEADPEAFWEAMAEETQVHYGTAEVTEGKAGEATEGLPWPETYEQFAELMEHPDATLSDMKAWEDAHPVWADKYETAVGWSEKNTGSKPKPTPAAAAAAQVFKNFTPSKTGEEHAGQVVTLIGKPAVKSTTYRWKVGMLIKEAEKFGGPAVMMIPNLKIKLAESWAKEYAGIWDKAKSASINSGEYGKLKNQAKKVFDKMEGLGWTASEDETVKAVQAGKMPTQFPASAPKAVPVASKPAPAPAPGPKPAAAPAPKPAPAPSFPAPTEAELTKAKKTVALQPQFLGIPDLPVTPAITNAIQAFNLKYQGKDLSANHPALVQKVNDFKKLQADVAAMAGPEKAKALEAQKTAAAAEAAKIAKEMADPAVAEHYQVLKNIGAGAKNLWKYAEGTIKNHGLKITPQQGAYIQAYVGSHYGPVNEQLRAGHVTIEQYKYAKALDDALENMPKYQGDVVRGASLTAAQFDRYKKAIGKVLPEPGFQSAGKKGKLWGEYTFKIKSKTGRDISSFNPSEGGGEILFKNNTGFFVHSVSGKTIVMEEI